MKKPVGTFTASHSNGYTETLTFSTDKTASVAHSLVSNGETHSNSIDIREARGVLRVWIAQGIVS